MLKLSVPVNAVLLLLLSSSSNGFLQIRNVSLKPAPLFALPTAEESAKALSDYMAKSHESKLKAVKEVEDKKNDEIQELKKELELLKGQSSSSSIVPTAATEGSSEDLVSKLNAYQQFMSDYIVRAQEDKLKAVKTAEASVAQKYEAKMSLLLGAAPSSSSPSSPPPAVATTTATNNIFDARNEKITAAGKAGKSRWGTMEVQKVSTGKVVSSTPPTTIAGPSSSSSAIAATNNDAGVKPAFDTNNPPPEVIAADHGLRADGGVGGLTLAQRIALGVNANGTPSSSSVAVNPIFEKRNALVSAAGKAGKSRWGVMEIEKATNFAKTLPSSSNNVVVDKPEVVAADHGLRADGGIGGPTLSERVNLGAMLLSA